MLVELKTKFGAKFAPLALMSSGKNIKSTIQALYNKLDKLEAICEKLEEVEFFTKKDLALMLSFSGQNIGKVVEDIYNKTIDVQVMRDGILKHLAGDLVYLGREFSFEVYKTLYSSKQNIGQNIENLIKKIEFRTNEKPILKYSNSLSFIGEGRFSQSRDKLPDAQCNSEKIEVNEPSAKDKSILKGLLAIEKSTKLNSEHILQIIGNEESEKIAAITSLLEEESNLKDLLTKFEGDRIASILAGAGKDSGDAVCQLHFSTEALERLLYNFDNDEVYKKLCNSGKDIAQNIDILCREAMSIHENIFKAAFKNSDGNFILGNFDTFEYHEKKPPYMHYDFQSPEYCDYENLQHNTSYIYDDYN
jgi:hypothetical protein